MDIRDELNSLSLGRRHWIVVLILCMVTLFDGYDTFAPAYVIPYALKTWRLMPSQAGLLVSSGLVGFMIGSLCVGLIADRVGRKPTLLTAMLCAAAFDLTTANVARSFEVFILLRLLTGLGLGMLLPLSVTLINEFMPRRTTNMLVGVVMIGWSGGGIVAALLGLALAPRFGWPSLFWVDGLAIPVVAAGAVLLRESPRFLAFKARQVEARAAMRWLAPERAQHYAAAVFRTGEDAGRKGSLMRLLQPSIRAKTLVVWFCAAASLFTIFGLSSWVPQTMIQRGESLGASFAFGALLQFAAVLGGVGCGWAADRLDRRTVLSSSWGLAAVAIIGLALINSHPTNMLFIFVSGFCVMGAQPVLNNFTASLYETEIKSTGVGVELGVGRIGGILGPYIGGWLKELFPGSLVLFSAMALTVALCAATILSIRETAGQDVQAHG